MDNDIIIPQGDASELPGGSLRYSTLSSTHCNYKREYRDLLMAMSIGGEQLLKNDVFMRELLPPHNREDEEIYSKRCKKAVYSNYCGEILGYLFSMMQSDPLLIRMPEVEDDEELGKKVDNKVGSAGASVEGSASGGKKAESLPDWIDKLTKNCSYSYRKQITYSDFILAQIRSMVTTEVAWTLVDLPETTEEFQSLADQEAAGKLQPYFVALPSNTMLDWGEDERGELLWCVHYVEDKTRRAITDDRKKIKHCWTVYTVTEDKTCKWERYELLWNEGKKIPDSHPVPLVASGVKPVMPVRRTDCPKGLWLMDSVYSLAAESFRKESNLAWFEAQSLAQELYEFLAPDDNGGGGVTIGEGETAKEIAAFNSPRGAGYVQVRGHEDRAEYLAPQSDIYRYALESKRNVKDEIHRLLYVISLSIEQNSSALRRSSISKTQDKIAEEVILASISTVAMQLVRELLIVAAKLRGDKDAAIETIKKLKVSGYENFTADSDGAIIESAIKASLLNIPSKTFQVHNGIRVVRAALGVEVDQETLEKIRDELDEAYEAMYAHPDMAGGIAPKGELTGVYGNFGKIDKNAKKAKGPGDKPTDAALKKAGKDTSDEQDFAHKNDPSIAQGYKKPWHKK